MSVRPPHKVFLAAMAVVVLALSGACGGEEGEASDATARTLSEEPVGRAGGERIAEDADIVEGTEPSGERVDGCARRESGGEGRGIRIGDFAPPGEAEGTPPYEVLEEERVERDCVRAVRLLVDTRADDEAGYTLIARDLKAKYEDLDAVTVEFTDTSGAFAYEGSALIFNTPPGSYYIGYSYGPPNNEGYIVDVAD
ncbi:MAG TPA: hypothetical protein VKA51_04165 [Rubrobacteraceae bacterium]|nr:hypothetical protein [Rubrobacteraceae bacterium]